MISVLAPVISHDEKGYIACYLDHLDLRNPMVTLISLSASCDASAGANGIT